MKRTELFLLLVAIGSLWGFFEMLDLPVFILCTIGLFFLVIARQVVNIPATSIIIGLIACFYKTYSDHFFICQWAGVLALAGSFDFFTSLLFKENWSKRFNPMLIAFLTNIAALIVFTIVVVFIFKEPNWASGGIERVIRYTLNTSLPAAFLSGLISAPLGVIVATKLNQVNFPLRGRFIPILYLIISAFLWIAV